MPQETVAGSQVSEWYSGKCVFITGATGFLGKVLIEKLLRSCPDIKTIYILLRSKRGVLAEDRLTTLLKLPLFDNIRINNAESFKKIVVIKGDVSQQNLGICLEDRAVLARNVSVVFHSAATIKFNEPIATAVGMNVIGTREVINLAYEMKNLQAFVHVSTAFSNCNRKETEEKLYEPPIELDKLKQIMNVLDDDSLNDLTPRLLKGWPNTYTWTKALAEQLVAAHARDGGLPVVILRPSIVTAAWQEPVPGWIDNINGFTGIMLAGANGIVRAILAHPKNIPCFIPVDAVVNLMVTTAWQIGVNKCKSVLIYNLSTGMINPITQQQIYRILMKLNDEYPSNTAIWYPNCDIIPYVLPYRIHCILTRIIPARIIDFVLMILGKKTFAVKLSSKINEMMGIYEHFVREQWKFHSENIPKLLTSLSVTDKELFNFDVRRIGWNEYLKIYYLGANQFILKESMNNFSAARVRMRRLKIVYYSLYFLVLFGFFAVLIKFVFNINLLSILVS